MKKTVLIVDVGTSKVHVTLVNTEDGSIVDTASQPYQWVHQREGWSQVSALEIWGAAEKTLEAIVTKNKSKAEFAAIAFSYMGDALLPVDRNYTPLTDVILCFDVRAKAQAERMKREFGSARFSQITSGVLGETVCPSKMLWIQEELPDVFFKTSFFLSIQQYFNIMLGLGDATDYTLACRKCVYDVKQHRWSESICQYLGLPISMMGSTIAPSDAVIGTITHFGQVALPAPVPVILGAHDSECGLLGVGCLPENCDILGDVAGTYDHIGCFTNQYGKSIQAFGGWTCSGPVDNSYVIMGGSVGGTNVDWVVNTFFPNQGNNILPRLFANAKFDGSQNVILTQGVETGNGKFRGIHFKAKGEDFFEAAVEGATLPLIDIVKEHISLRGKPFSCTRIGGGAARSGEWVQLKANLFNMPVERVQSTEVSALGAAVLATHALGIYPSLKAASENLIQVKDVFYPQKDKYEIYTHRFEQLKSNLQEDNK